MASIFNKYYNHKNILHEITSGMMGHFLHLAMKTPTYMLKMKFEIIVSTMKLEKC